MRQNRTNRGFSLIEVLIALCVMSLGVLGLLRLQTEIDKFAEHARHQTEALCLAENHLEELRRRSVDGPGTHINTQKFTDIGNVPKHRVDNFTLEREVMDIAGTASAGGPTAPSFAKHIKVIVTWQDRLQNPHSVVLETVIAAYSEFD